MGSTLGALALAYFGGILSSLTPCIYPMIPITIGVVGGMADPQRNPRIWRHTLFRSAVYVLGMTLVYSFLGVLAGATGRVFGSLTQSAGWYATLGVIVIGSALIMMDIIPFDPQAWWNRFSHRFLGERAHRHPTHASSAHSEMTALGALVLGATSGFIAAPCTTPVLASILAYIANTRSIGLGFLLMAFFSAGLGTLLIVIGLFAGRAQALPRSGIWMVRIKKLSGLILLAYGVYLVFQAGSF